MSPGQPGRRRAAVGKRRRAGRASAARTARSKRPPGHAAGIKAARPVVCGVITVSDTRRGDADTGGALVERLIGRAGHRVAVRAWVRDDAREIRRAAGAALARRDVDCVILTGGTGLSPRDRTPESLAPLAEKWLPGFGELFRVLSLKQVGAAAWLSRAAAFVARGKLVVTLPGSTAAVELAMKKLLLPELAHTLRALGRFSTME